MRRFPVNRLLGAAAIVVACVLAATWLASYEPAPAEADQPSQTTDDSNDSNDENTEKSDNKNLNRLDKLDRWRENLEDWNMIDEGQSQEWEDQTQQIRDLVEKGESAKREMEQLRDEFEGIGGGEGKDGEKIIDKLLEGN